MITDYYQLFGLKRFEAFLLTDQQIFERLSETVEMGYSIDDIVSRFETGIYILSNDYIKSRYDYILKYGWWTILTNPFKLMYVLWIIGIVRIRSMRRLGEE
jgi:hypothetical protein